MKSQTDTFSSICLHKVVSRKIVSWSRIHHINHNLRWKKTMRIKWAMPQFVQLEKFITHKFPAVTLISAPVGTSYGHQYVYFIKLGRKLSRKFKKTIQQLQRKKKSKQTNKRHSNLGGNKYWGSLIKNCQSFRLRQT